MKIGLQLPATMTVDIYFRPMYVVFFLTYKDGLRAEQIKIFLMGKELSTTFVMISN